MLFHWNRSRKALVKLETADEGCNPWDLRKIYWAVSSRSIQTIWEERISKPYEALKDLTEPTLKSQQKSDRYLFRIGKFLMPSKKSFARITLGNYNGNLKYARGTNTILQPRNVRVSTQRVRVSTERFVKWNRTWVETLQRRHRNPKLSLPVSIEIGFVKWN